MGGNCNRPRIKAKPIITCKVLIQIWKRYSQILAPSQSPLSTCFYNPNFTEVKKVSHFTSWERAQLIRCYESHINYDHLSFNEIRVKLLDGSNKHVVKGQRNHDTYQSQAAWNNCFEVCKDVKVLS